MKDIILEVIIILLLICIVTLIIIQIRKTHNINNVLIDTNDMLEDFNNCNEPFTSSSDDKMSEKYNDTNQHPYINLTSRLNTLENEVATEKIVTALDRKLLYKIRDNINKLAKATGNPPL